MVGRIAQEKGPQVFAKAAQLADCKAVFIGDGDKHKEVLKLCPSAVMTGWLSYHDMRKHLSTARALVFPSLWYETDGLTVMEAAAIGIPAIVSDASAARNSVIDGVTGSWFRTGDARDLADKIEGMRNDDLAEQMGRAAHAHYWKNPRTLDRHVKELEQVYEKVLAC
jgi:glycosyltransferase involved in cell wall biosynthesis